MASEPTPNNQMEQLLNKTQETLPPGKHYVVGGAILRDLPQTPSPPTSPQLLVIKRAAHEPSYPNHWEIPGGALEPGETIRQALIREIHEETGLVVTDVLRELTASAWGVVGGGDEWIQYKFLVTVEQPTRVRLDPNEHGEWRWVTEEGSRALLRAGGQVDGMDEVFRIAKGWEGGRR